jgi:hypothetical protein
MLDAETARGNAEASERTLPALVVETLQENQSHLLGKAGRGKGLELRRFCSACSARRPSTDRRPELALELARSVTIGRHAKSRLDR